MNVLELFAGAGGGIYGAMLLGHTPVCAVEIVAKNRELLLQRQRDGIMPRFPIWDDVRTFDGRSWRGVVDIVSGGFPCTDISAAGKGAGIDGESSGLWREMARIVREVRPRYVFVENSPMLLVRGIGRVVGDLAEIGYDCRWTCLSAAECGAPHKRDRIWIIAHSNQYGRQWADVLLQQRRQNKTCAVFAGDCETSADAMRNRLERSVHVGYHHEEKGHASRGQASGVSVPGGWKSDHPKPGILGMDDGLADWKHRIFALGNGQVPRVHAAAWRELMPWA